MGEFLSTTLDNVYMVDSKIRLQEQPINLDHGCAQIFLFFGGAQRVNVKRKMIDIDCRASA
jgi:hypothetical protein